MIKLPSMHLPAGGRADWRDWYNPLRGLTIAKAVTLLEANERGDTAELQWLLRMIEKRDAVLRGGKRNLLGALSELDWDIRVVEPEDLPPGTTEAQAEAQQQALREHYEGIENLDEAIAHLGLAEFRGFSHLEPHYEDGRTICLQPVPQWHMKRPTAGGPWLYDPRAQFGSRTGVPIPDDWVVREVDDPIGEIALIVYIWKSLDLKDWAASNEVFGIPSIFVTMPDGVPADQWDAYLDLAKGVVSDSRGVIPPGGKAEAAFQNVNRDPFGPHLEYLDQQTTLAITSGLLTMLAESGSGTLAGGAHSRTFARVVRGLGKQVSAVLQRQQDKPVLEAKFPGQRRLAYFSLAVEEEADAGDYLDGVVKLTQAGMPVEPSQVKERTGYELRDLDGV